MCIFPKVGEQLVSFRSARDDMSEDMWPNQIMYLHSQLISAATLECKGIRDRPL